MPFEFGLRKISDEAGVIWNAGLKWIYAPLAVDWHFTLRMPRPLNAGAAVHCQTHAL